MLTGIYHMGRLLRSPPYIQVIANLMPLHGAGQKEGSGWQDPAHLLYRHEDTICFCAQRRGNRHFCEMLMNSSL